MTPTHIDCFSGVGGICTGMHAAGFNTLLAIEKVESCVETYSRNHPEVTVINNDIRKVTKKQILDVVGNQEIDLVTSGMPCETFSTAGATSRSFYDERQYLFEQGIRVAKSVNSKFILFENVPGILTKRVSKDSKRLIIDDLYESLEKAGYKNHVSIVLNAANFGVPQYRERFFILATRLKDIKLEVPEPKSSISRTVNDALLDLPDVEVNSGKLGTEYLNKTNEYIDLMKNDKFWRRVGFDTKLTYHMPPNHRPGTIKRIKLTKEGEGLKDLFAKYTEEEIKKLQEEHVLPKKVYIQRGRRLIGNSISPTVTSHCLDELIHPRYDRALTVRECARLQGFPDSYDFIGGPYIIPHLSHTQDKYEQIGDAVPPLLAFAWGEKIIEIINSIKGE